MAKILDKMFNRVIEGDLLEISQSDLENSGLGKLIPSAQATVTVVSSALTNINGRTLTSYEACFNVVGGYNAIIITKGHEVLSEEQAEDYMEYMTGSRFLPVYNYEKPQNSIFLFADGGMYKPQYDSENGLVLYFLKNTSYTKLYKHTMTVYCVDDEANPVEYTVELFNNNPSSYSGYVSTTVLTDIINSNIGSAHIEDIENISSLVIKAIDNPTGEGYEGNALTIVQVVNVEGSGYLELFLPLDDIEIEDLVTTLQKEGA